MKYDIFKSRDIVYIKKLFTKEKNRFFPGLEKSKITNITIKEVSPSWAKDTCLNKYKIQLDNKYIREIRETSSAKNSKKKIWQIMNYIYNNSFHTQRKTTPRPIYFVSQHNLLFYDEVPGTPLSVLISQNDTTAVKKSLISAGQWLTQLHQLEIKKNFKKAFYPGTKGYKILFTKIKRYLPELKKDLIEIKKIEFTDKIWEAEKALIHADFYPGNIIINKNIFSVIDFDKTGVGPSLMDVATLYGCLEFPDTSWKLQFSQKKRKDFQEIFLQSYCQAKNIDFIKTKIKLRKFLAKIFLDQLRYYFLFDRQNVNLMARKDRANLINKLRDLILKIKIYL